MNFKTTIVLLILVIGGGLSWLVYSLSRPAESASPTLAFLTNDLQADQITRLEITKGQRTLILERLPGQEWTLPGKWPVREVEVHKLAKLLSGLRSRFAAIPLGDPPALKDFGLDADPLLVHVTLGDRKFTLALGEESGEANRFSRATFLRLDKSNEVLRLGPGLIAQLDRPQEYFQQRRLFPVERVAKDADSAEKVERLLAESVTVQTPGGSYKLAKVGDDWQLQEPVKDRLDPEKRKSLLIAFADIWAEQFVDKKDRKLDDFGLEKPEQTIIIQRGKDAVTLLIGKTSQTKEREVTKQGPPSQFGPPKTMVVKVAEEYRFAKLQENDQVFEIKADKLKEVAVAAETLRDAQLARFKTDDARRLEITYQGQQLVLEKDKDRWHLKKPREQEAESSQVTELLDKLAGLQAKDKEIIDKGDVKAFGLDKPAVVKVKVEESKPAKTREFTFLLGTKEADKSKVYAQVEGWPRINTLDDAVLKLIQRPALAYRGRKVLEGASADLAKIEVQRGGDTFALEQVKGVWKLAAPVQAEVDAIKVDQLAREAARIEAVEFVTEEAKADELDKTYGLTKPTLTAKLTYSDAKKPAQKLLLGKQRPGKEEYFARLEASPAVFVVRKATFEAIDKDSLALRPLQLWDLKADEIGQLKIHKEDPEYVVKRGDKGWQISGPFAAEAVSGTITTISEALANLKAEKFVAHSAKDLGPFGLDKPYLRVAVAPAAKKEDKEAPKERILLIGKTTTKDGKARYARLGDSEAIFELGDKVLTAIDRSALDLLDRHLLAVDLKAIKRLQTSGAVQFTLQPNKEDGWQVVDSPAPPFNVEDSLVEAALSVWARLGAAKFAAYGAKIDWAAFGLDKPSTTISLTVQTEADKDKSKTVTHTLALGREVKDQPGQRYARLDKADAVVVLDAATVRDLHRSHLDFVNPRVLKYDLDRLTAIQRRMGKEELTIIKKGDTWRLEKPADQVADVPMVENILDRTFRLRAKKVAAYPAKDLAPFGLDKPEAIVTLKLADPAGKVTEHTIKIGKIADGTKEAKEADRFAVVDKGEAVVVLDGQLADMLVAPALRFRDHNLAIVTNVDKAVLERGARKVTFAKIDGVWKVTAPLTAEAEQGELEEFLGKLSRLRAHQLVADKPADWKPFGLVKPQATWRLSAGDKEVLTVNIGGPAEQVKGEEPTLHARLGTSDLVFQLNAKLSSQALAEYRGRKPWTPFDAAQVEKVGFGQPTNPFVLTKEDNNWLVVGKPQLKIDAKKVSDTLDALAALKVVRYVEDHKPDLALYGLQEPALKVDVVSTGGKRTTLLIGRAEGASKRYYATAPAETPQAVFIISEADAQRIMRPLTAFVEETRKEK